MEDHMRKQLNLIQVSRALVPLFVLLFHANEMMDFYFDYNFLGISVGTKSGGVYYFFALSGFMMYYIYHTKIGNKGIIKDFLYSRFIRIFPVYWILTLLILPIYFIIPGFGDGNEREFSTIMTSLLLIPRENEPILGVAWSLIHTVYFYLLFSLVLFKNSKISMAIIFIWSLLSVAFSLKILSSSHYLLNFFFNFNNLIFLSGVACAYCVSKIRIPSAISIFFIIVGFSGFPLSWVNAELSFINLGLQMITTLSSVFLILGLSSIDLRKEITIPSFAKYLGESSLSIYLTHKLTLSLLCKTISIISFIAINNKVLSIFIIVISILVGCFVYSFIEKPLNHKLKELKMKRENKFTQPEILKV